MLCVVCQLVASENLKVQRLSSFHNVQRHRAQSTGGMHSVWPQQNMASYALASQCQASPSRNICNLHPGPRVWQSYRYFFAAFSSTFWHTDHGRGWMSVSRRLTELLILKFLTYISRWECSLRRLFTRGYLSIVLSQIFPMQTCSSILYQHSTWKREQQAALGPPWRVTRRAHGLWKSSRSPSSP